MHTVQYVLNQMRIGTESRTQPKPSHPVGWSDPWVDPTRWSTRPRPSLSVVFSDYIVYTISRYRLRIQRAYDILWRPYIVRYRARTYVSRVRCSHTAAAASASDLCRLPCTTSVQRSLCLMFPGVDLSCSALGACGGDWGTAVAPVVG